MLTRAQQILLKRAQREAGIDDDEYRQWLANLVGCRSSKDPELDDESLDKLLSFFEAIYWRGVDAGSLQPPCKGNEVFKERGFWASRNRKGNTSRDRFVRSELHEEIQSLETALAEIGYGPQYCAAIRKKVMKQRGDRTAVRWYKSALERTLTAKVKGKVEIPF